MPDKADVVIRRVGEPGDLGWIVQAHGELYAREHGWDGDFETLVAGIVARWAEDHDPEREAGWVAEVDGRRVGSVLCVAGSPEVAVLRLLLVEPSARGLGVGGRLVGTCVEFARDAGFHEMTLWTNDVLAAARRIYVRAGFELVDEESHHSFGHDLVGQHWRRTLTG